MTRVKTIRSEAEAGYLYHCGQAFMVVVRLHYWPWGDWWEALCTLATFLEAVACLVLLPVIVPLAGYTRKRDAMRRAEMSVRGHS